jgi:hypothetical protein
MTTYYENVLNWYFNGPSASTVAAMTEIESEIELNKQKHRLIAGRQMRSHYLRHAAVRLGPFPTDCVAMRFPSRKSFYDFVQETGAGSWAIECSKPIAMLSIEQGTYEHARAYYGAKVANFRLPSDDE